MLMEIALDNFESTFKLINFDFEIFSRIILAKISLLDGILMSDFKRMVSKLIPTTRFTSVWYELINLNIF